MWNQKLLATWKHHSQHLLSNPHTIIFFTDARLSTTAEQPAWSPSTTHRTDTTEGLFSLTKGTNVLALQITHRMPFCKILVIRFVTRSSYPLLKRFNLKLFCCRGASHPHLTLKHNQPASSHHASVSLQQISSHLLVRLCADDLWFLYSNPNCTEG